ncbi:MAG TPA: hypothetical protein VMX11_04540 [Actinomycetes bacterium]|nr:hypothetical protein [Actinomycetes bacterium]
MAYADQRASDGITRWRTRKIDARLATIEDDLDSGAIGGGGGGGDSWTYARISSDFSVSTNPAVDTDVSGMAFTPAASKNYEIEGRFLVTAGQTANGVQIGAVWPTGLVTPSAVRIDIPFSPIQYNNINLPRSTNGRVSTQGTISTSLESLGLLWGMLSTDASPSGTFKITIKSEGNGQTATMKAGSFIRYREIPTS